MGSHPSPGRAGVKGEEMTSDTLRELDERIAELFRDGSPISTPSEPPQATSVDQQIIDAAVFEASVIETAGGRKCNDYGRATRLSAGRIRFRHGDPSTLGAARYQSQANKNVTYQVG